MQLSTPGPSLTVDTATIAFDDTPILVDVSITVQPGDIVGLSGANGSGKTSLLRVIANVCHPLHGTRVGPTTCAYVPAAIDPMGIRSGDWLRMFPRAERSDPRPLLQQLGFDSDLSKRLVDLSFGNLRKLLLAEALTSGELLIVIDEFAAGLDEHGTNALHAQVSSLARAGTMIVLAEQQSRPFPIGSQLFAIENHRLVPASAPERDTDVHLRGPKSRAAELAAAAADLGFRPVAQ